MRKFYTGFCSVLVILTTVLTTFSAKAQTTINTTVGSTGYVDNNGVTGNSVVTFVIENNSGGPIQLTQIGNYFETASNNTMVTLWYSSTSLSGAATVATPAWTQIATAGPIAVPTEGIHNLFTGLSFVIPSGTQYRFALQSSINMRYAGTGTVGASPSTFTSGGVSLKVGDAQISGSNVGYAGAFPTPPNSPRFFIGTITFQPFGPCTSPPTPGDAVATPSTPICTGTAVNLTLSGASVGTGQTYQWQSGPSATGPWTNVGASSANSDFIVNPATSTWYRAEITCSGNTQPSDPVQVVVNPSFPAGTYTINGANPTGGTNFQTFAAAVNALSCGIAGPVVFNVAAGTYEEQVTIPQIGGASAVNTITFNGNDATLQAVATTSARHILRLDGADYVTISNLNIVALSGNNFGWGVHLTNGADNNTIDLCSIDISTVTSTTQSNSAGIVVSGSTTSVLTDGSASNNTFSNNTITGAYQGIIINGITGGASTVGNTIHNNDILDFYTTGIELTENNGAVISNNDISRATRGTVGVFAGIELGAGNTNVNVFNNRIHDTHNIATTQTGIARGIYSNANDAPAGSENRVYNNLIYNFNSTGGGQYGIANTSSDGARYYHNTIVLNGTDGSADDTKGFYQTTAATNIEFRNNIVYLTRGGTGDKHAIHINTTTSSVVSNNNVLFVNAAGDAGFVGGYGTTDFTTLADWQSANSGAYDQASMSLDPLFVDIAAANFYPNNSSFASLGANVSIATDIVGVSRDASPTPGAYQILATAGIDVGAFQLLLPAQQICYSNAETVTVTIRNFSSSVHDFTTTPVTVNVAVTGPNATTFAPVIVNTGTLAPDGTLNVVISTTYDMSAPGTYEFSASTTATGDAIAVNDSMAETAREVVALDAGTASSSPASYCVTGGIPTLSLDGSNGGTIQWQESPLGTTGTWINVGTNNISYTPAAAIAATRYYRAVITCGTNHDTSNVVTVALNNPQILTIAAATRCGPGTVTLNATASGTSELNWYAAATGGAALFTGPAFTTPIIANTTTYYVAASEGGSSESVGKTAPTTTPNTSGNGWGLVFDVVNSPITLQSVDIFSVGATGGTMSVELHDNTGTVIATAGPFNYPAGSTASPVMVTLPVNFTIPVGTGYRIVSASMSGGAVIRETSGNTYPYSSASGNVVITSGYIAGTSTTYYWFYNWQVSTGCESPRQAVTATITAAPAFDVTNDLTVCNNAIATLQVNSSLANFDSYTWTPVTGLFTDPGATTAYTGGNAPIVFARMTTPGTYTYIATANNTTTGCQNIDSLHLTVLPATVTVSALPPEICVSGSTTLSYTPFEGFGTATAQWFSSPDGTTFTPITNATGVTYGTPTLTATTHYRLEIQDGAGNSCMQPSIVVNVNNPLVLTSTPATRCGDGTLTLGATAAAGTELAWYTEAVGGSPVGTGTSFTTPSLSASTTYYVAARQGGGSSTVGVSPTEINCGTMNTSTATDWPLRFNTTAPVVIDSVWVIPTGTNLTIALRQALSTANIQTKSFTFQAADIDVPQRVALGWTISTSGNYQLTNTSGGIARIGTFTCNYPFVSAFGGFQIVGSATFSNAATSTTQYNSFYSIKVTEGCESPRTAVSATVSPNTGIITQPVNQAVCTGANVLFTVGAEGAGLTYQWRKGTTDIANSNNDTLQLNAVTAADAGTYSVVITGLCGNVTSTEVTLAVAANNAWLGVVSNDWNTPGNWCGGVPTSASDVVITAGTPYAPVVNGIAEVRNLTVSSGTSVTVAASAFLNIFGDFSNAGTFSAPSGYVAFKGTANQTIGEITAGSVIMNGTGGITLAGDMTVENTLVLTNGNITLGANDLILNSTATGTPASHIVTNGTGSVISNNITTDAVTVPVGPNATSYNPVIISNGQGRNYTVRVATGITPSINNPNRAVNRTWYVMPNTVPGAPVNVVFQFVDADMNASASSTLVMEAAVHNGTSWNVVSPATGVTPSGTPTDRQVGIVTNQFGPTAIGNFGAITFPTATAGVDADVTSMVMMPNIVRNQSVLRVNVRRTMKINWAVVDANGRIVMTFTKQLFAGQNDIQLQLGILSQGAYQIVGSTEKGKTGVLKFIRVE